MDIKNIIQEEIKRILREGFYKDESARIIKGPRGFALGMAAPTVDGKMLPRSIESPFFGAAQDVCKFYANWDPSTATMQESILREDSIDFSVVGDPVEICAVNVTEDNYPAGARHDSNAPWNQEDAEIRSGEKADKINFEVIWYSDGAGFTILKDKKGRLYAFNEEMVENDDYEPYADREEIYMGQDEDGFADIEYGDWDLDGEVIENYINDNMSEIKVGKGLDAWESGDYHAAEIDDEIKQDLMGTAKYIRNIQAKQSLLDILGGINEVAEKIIDTPTMDTPTGTLFTISVGE